MKETIKLTKEKLTNILEEKIIKPTLLSPTKQSKIMNKNLKKEISKQSGKNGLKTKPNIKIKENFNDPFEKDDAAMNISGYNDLGIGVEKHERRKKDIDPSFQNFKHLTYESLNYIDESDNNKTSSLKTIKRDLKEDKKIMTKQELIENTLKEDKKTKGNPWAICSSKINKKENPEKYEKCVREVKKQYGIEENITEEEYLKELEIIDETTTSASSGQYSTKFAWAPNKKGWANSKKRWWGENSPNTGGNISKGGIVNIKDNCRGFQNGQKQGTCNSGDISNITITEDSKPLIFKLAKEYNKKPEQIEKLIKEDYLKNKKQLNEMWKNHLQNVYTDKGEWLRYDEIYGLSQRLGYDDPEQAWSENPLIQGSTNPEDYKRVINEQISDKQISEFVKKQLIKEGYLKQTKDNWKGEGCKNYDDSRDICLDKEVNEYMVKGDRPIYKQKSTGEIWELEDIGDNYAKLINLKDATLIINVGTEELKNDYIKLGNSNVQENIESGSEEYEQSGKEKVDFGSVDKNNVIDYIISIEKREEVASQRTVELYSYLIKSGMINKLDDNWKDYANKFINLGALTPEGNILIGIPQTKNIPAYGLNEKKENAFKLTEKEFEEIWEKLDKHFIEKLIKDTSEKEIGWDELDKHFTLPNRTYTPFYKDDIKIPRKLKKKIKSHFWEKVHWKGLTNAQRLWSYLGITNPNYKRFLIKKILEKDKSGMSKEEFAQAMIKFEQSTSKNEKKENIIRLTEKEFKDILEKKLNKENYPSGNNSSYVTPGDVESEMGMYDM